MHTTVIAVSACAAGVGGWYCRTSATMAGWTAGARGASQPATSQRPEGQPPPGRLSCARWALAAALATGAVVASVPARGPHALPVLALLSLAVWALALVVLALIDRESLVVPTKLVRAAVVAAISLLALGSFGTGDWRHLWQGAACAAIAACSFGAWSAVNPRGLGFGDARMASLVALGAGALSPLGSLVALACSPLAAGLVGQHRLRNDPGAGQATVALGPFLAVGGLAVVMAHAC